MGVWARFKRSLRAMFGGIIEKTEDPELILQQTIRDMRDRMPELNNNVAQVMANERLLAKSKERLELTARGIRQIAQKAMLDIFASLRRDQFGKHGATRRGASGQRLEETKAYVFGEPFDIHLARTVMNAVLRTAAQPPLRLAPQDFEVHGSESVSRCSTVLLPEMK